MWYMNVLIKEVVNSITSHLISSNLIGSILSIASSGPSRKRKASSSIERPHMSSSEWKLDEMMKLLDAQRKEMERIRADDNVMINQIKATNESYKSFYNAHINHITYPISTSASICSYSRSTIT